MQAGATGFMSAINRFGDLGAYYFSPFITYNYRVFLTDEEPWRKDEDETFMYGYFYANMLCILGIVLVFAPVMPEIALAGIVFLTLIHAAHFHQ